MLSRLYRAAVRYFYYGRELECMADELEIVYLLRMITYRVWESVDSYGEKHKEFVF